MGKRAKAEAPDEPTADPQADEPQAGAELDVAALEAWRAKPVDGLGIDNTVILFALDSEEIATVGGIIDLYDGFDAADPAAFDPLERPPLNLTQGQAKAVQLAVAATVDGTGLDPAAVLPWHRPAAQPDADPSAGPEADEPVVLIDPASPEALAKYDAETARLVAAAERNVNELEGEWEDQHGRAAIAKKEFEQARDKMRALIRERDANRGVRDLFTAVDGNSAHPPADPGTPDPLADLWQSYPIESYRWLHLGLTKKDVEKLNAGETKSHGTHPLLTMGDVTRFITPNPANPAYARTLKDVKGFGDKGMERWTEAETKFWRDWNNGGKLAFAAEKGLTVEAGHASQPGAGGGDGEGRGDGAAAAGEAAEPTLADFEGSSNPLPDATAEPRKKQRAKPRKAKGKSR